MNEQQVDKKKLIIAECRPQFPRARADATLVGADSGHVESRMLTVSRDAGGRHDVAMVERVCWLLKY